MTQILVPESSADAADPLFSKPAEFDEAWKARIAHLASFIDSPGPVLDIGCGMMWLEPLLARGNKYIPIDYVRRDDRTVVVDLNAQPLPAIDAEFAFMSGVLEYIQDVPGFLRQLTRRKIRRIMLTYCTIECWWKMPLRKSLNVLLPEYSIVALQRFQKHVALVVDRRE